MKKIEKRAAVCLALALALVVGLAVFVARFVMDGSQWASFPANRHLYNQNGQLAVGRVLDRDGDVLSWVGEDGSRAYYANTDVRKATLHAVGDAAGNIGTGALVSFADRLTGYNLLTGAYTPMGTGNDVYLTLDAHYNYIAYKALGGKKGSIGVYNYKTGEVLCMVSSPTFDPMNPPKIQEGDEKWEGVYLNHFLSGSFAPGSVFKTVTLAAALEQIPDIESRRFTCTGSTQVGGESITCPKAHGEQDISQALANSCNGAFAQLAAELGGDCLTQYAQKSGLTGSYSVNGIQTKAGQFDVSGAATGELGWAGVGQYRDLVNPCGMMVYMGAVANAGKAAVPKLVLKTEKSMGLPSLPPLTHHTKTLIEPETALQLADMMAKNVTDAYGPGRFPNMDICAKSGTAQVGDGQRPHAWFTGFLRGEDTPYAFVVLVENGGSGADVAGTVAAKVLDAIVNGY